MIYILLAMLFNTAVIITGTIASRNINTNLVAAISNIVSDFIPLIVVIPLLNKKILTPPNAKFGIIMAIICGVLIGLFTMAMSKSYSVNKVAIVAPIVFGGSMFLSAIYSAVFLKEKITTIQGAGLFLLAVALGLITYARMTGK